MKENRMLAESTVSTFAPAARRAFTAARLPTSAAWWRGRFVPCGEKREGLRRKSELD